MNITLISTSVTLAVILICFAIIIKTYWNASVGPLTIKRRAIIAAYSALSIYLCSYFVRDCNDETEIFCVTSILMLYILWESYLFACNIFSNGSLYRNRYVWLFYNLFPLALAIPHLLFVFTGEDYHFRNYTELIDAFLHPAPIQAYTRILFVAGLLVCKVFILIEVTNQQLKYRQQIIEEDGDLRGCRNRSRSYLAWAIILLLASFGQIIPSLSYHIGLKLGIIFAVIYTTRFYLQFHKRLMILEEQENHKGESIKEKVSTWLKQDPFPLSETDLTMEKIAESIGVEASSLSYYIYEFEGSTFLSWQSECRMNRCKELLEDKDMNISEIAYECGYSDLAAMSKAFKKKFGLPPTLYRRRKLAIPDA